ncbi:hypothetical protein [Streptomyces sp. NPDC051567]|uniref:hypothetical protein n=1 Tax=Streptomyces sp. NPDC051567 TaxID=3365660 RepID=UPI0037924616
MKLKRLAVVAAAAVVGPTVLMATPAMADEAQNTAVTTPDSVPKDDPSAGTKAPESPKAPATPEAGTPAGTPKTPGAEKPAEKPAGKPAGTPKTSVTPKAPGGEKPGTGPETGVEEGDEDFGEYAEGPKVALKGLPKAGFQAGGDWQKITLTADNSGVQALKDYGFFIIAGNESDTLRAKHLDVQVFDGARWVAAEKEPSGQMAGATFETHLDKDERLTVELRVKFAKSAPVGAIDLFVVGASNDPDEPFMSEGDFYESKITKAATGGNTGGNGNTGNPGTGNGNGNGNGNNPNPNGGSTPIVDNGNGNGGGKGTTGTGGELAETGADAATSWALGGAGIALAMGAALVAGTGRRRRPTA